jgi:hypothetical protein
VNVIEELQLDHLMALVLKEFALDDRLAVRVRMTRVVYGWELKRIAGKLQINPQRVRALNLLGKALLDEAVEAGRLDRDELAAKIEGVLRRLKL